MTNADCALEHVFDIEVLFGADRHMFGPLPGGGQQGYTPAIGGTLGRIVVMQMATIIDGMFARTYGDMAPWPILIGLKSLFGCQRPDRKPAAQRRLLWAERV